MEIPIVDDALRRTRRNMIGVSVVLFLVYLVNGQFPNELEVFNYEIPLSSTAFEWLAWFFLTYMCVEYVTHLKSKFPEIRLTYRTHLVGLLSPYVEKNLSDKDRRKLKDYAESTQAEEYKFKNLTVDVRYHSGTIWSGGHFPAGMGGYERKGNQTRTAGLDTPGVPARHR